jgi:translin
MERSTSNLEAISQKIRISLSAKDTAREKALPLCREVIRHSANAIRAAHRSEFDRTRSSLDSARRLLQEINETLAECSNLLHSGFVHDAQKEYAEGCITLALILGEAMPDPEEVGVGDAAYLHGMGEAVGEMRRHLLDSIRNGDISHCEEVLSNMDDIYGVLVTMDFPDGLTYGLRRTTDSVRGILEKTRGDLTIAIRQRDLEQKLKYFEKAIKSVGKSPKKK